MLTLTMPEKLGPRITYGSSSIAFCICERAATGLVCVSYCLSSILRPSRPPLALISSIAIAAPSRKLVEDTAPAPDNSPMNAKLTGPDWATAPVATIVASAAASIAIFIDSLPEILVFDIISLSLAAGPSVGNRLMVGSAIVNGVPIVGSSRPAHEGQLPATAASAHSCLSVNSFIVFSGAYMRRSPYAGQGKTASAGDVPAVACVALDRDGDPGSLRWLEPCRADRRGGRRAPPRAARRGG